PAIIQLTRQHEGAASAQLATYWLGQPHSNVTVLRDGTGRLQGFLLGLWLEQLDETMLAADPVVAQVWTTMQRRNPLRPGERALFFRFWMAAADYQAVGQVQSNIFLQMVQQSVLTPGLAYTLIPTAEPAFWELMGDSIDFHAWPEATFVVDQKQYGVFGHDWRALPPHAWLALLAEREIALTAADTQPPPAAPLLVLSEAEFATAVRQALRDYTRPEFLKTNPLLRSRLVYADLPQAGDPREQLRHILAATAALMQETPKLAPFYEPLRLTYLEPAGTQEQVAEQLDLPFGTYRRHLKSGLEYLTERLWQRELGQ
ncbi:MAG: hypothetical protein KDE04_25640, partial [Anaerolineales bacterium]|nr:hypothetical protein [Anaerolineales bacterium]